MRHRSQSTAGNPEAEKLIGFGLAGNAPEEIREELRDLYETITFHRHLEIRGGKLSEMNFNFPLLATRSRMD